jgi:hypothetical protein
MCKQLETSEQALNNGCSKFYFNENKTTYIDMIVK